MFLSFQPNFACIFIKVEESWIRGMEIEEGLTGTEFIPDTDYIQAKRSTHDSSYIFNS
jgi:hypothetical protein